MIKHFLSFEKQISDLEGKIEELRHLSSGTDINIAEEIGKLQGDCLLYTSDAADE